MIGSMPRMTVQAQAHLPWLLDWCERARLGEILKLLSPSLSSAMLSSRQSMSGFKCVSSRLCRDKLVLCW